MRLEGGPKELPPGTSLREHCRQRTLVLELQWRALRTDAGAEDVPQLARGLGCITPWVQHTEQHKLEWVQSHDSSIQEVRAGESE